MHSLGIISSSVGNLQGSIMWANYKRTFTGIIREYTEIIFREHLIRKEHLACKFREHTVGKLCIFRQIISEYIVGS